MTDGRREYLYQTLTVAADKLCGSISVKVIHDDSGDPTFAAWLQLTYEPLGYIVHSTGQRSGFSGAIRSAWAWLREHDRNPYIFHLEDDFEVTENIDLTQLAATLHDHPELAQLALLRQAWSVEEIQAGGIIEQHPGSYEQRDGYIQHRRFFTTNPSLYRRDLITTTDWPDSEHSEGIYGINLFRRPDLYSAFWQGRQLCRHIGAHRVGTGY